MTKTATILIVDDQDRNRRLLTDFITSFGHKSVAAENGAVALEVLKSTTVDIVLLDVMMPVMDGYQTLQQLKADGALRHIPVVMISALDELQSITRCIEMGADDYLPKPFNPTVLRARLNGCLTKKELHDQEMEYERRIEQSNQLLEERVRLQVSEIASTQLALIFALANLAESRDPETGEHLERMRQYARILADRLRDAAKFEDVIDDTYVENIYVTAPLHDIGKVGVPDRILQKPGNLSEEEFALMKTHTTIGATTLRNVDERHPGNAFIRMGIEIAESHHEKWNGSGYPRALSGDAIPLTGRILALADVYDALTSKRCYKDAFSHDKSKEIILSGRGAHFDPDVVDAFLASEREFMSVREQHQDTEKVMLI
jgi:putative two-component system response regulator